MDQAIIFTLSAIVIVGGVLFAIIALLGRKGSKNLDVQKYRTCWMKIEHNLKKTEASSYTVAVFDADKLLDQALKERGFAGSTMGERMKNARTAFSSNNDVWTAHKLRNRIAHESGFQVSYVQVTQSLRQFKQGLKDMGAI